MATHMHTDVNGNVVIHEDHESHEHGHGHHHSHTQTKAVLNRMSRLIGHLESTKKMIENGRDCSEVLIQLSACNSALKGVGKVILKDHIDHCIVDAVKENNHEAIERLNEAINQWIK